MLEADDPVALFRVEQRADLARRPFADEVRDACRREQQLRRHAGGLAPPLGEEPLREDPAQAVRERVRALRHALVGERVEDPLDGRDRAARLHDPDHELARERDVERRGDGVGVAELRDGDDVGVGGQRRA